MKIIEIILVALVLLFIDPTGALTPEECISAGVEK
jgi:hypothetical protein